MHRFNAALRAFGLSAILLLAAPCGARAEVPSAQSGWWRMFGDPRLNALIERAHAGNPGIAEFVARLDAAHAAARLQSAQSAPQLGIDASASRAGGPLINDVGGSGSLFTTQASVSWEPDLFGKAARAAAAQRHDVAAAAAMLADMRLLVETETALALFECRAAAAAQQIAGRRLEIATQGADIIADRASRGLTSRLEASDAGLRLDAARDDLAKSNRRSELAQNRLAALIGETTPARAEAVPLPDAPAIPAGLSDRLLARRPDLVAARARVQAADARLAATRRAWLPDITLTASGGGASSSLGALLAAASRGYGFGLLLASPLLDGGRHKAQVAGARSAVALAEAEYRERLVAAFRETADCLALLAEGRQRAAIQAERTARSRLRLDSLTRSAGLGLQSRASLLEARLGELAAEQDELQARSAALASMIRLVKALGGDLA